MTEHYNRLEQKALRRNLRQEQTYTEKLVWRYLRNRQLKHCKFRRQYSVDGYVIDFYSPALKLAIEIDGGVHDLPEAEEHDRVRQNYLEGFGITFLRIRNEEFGGNAELAFGKIERVISNLTPGPSPCKGEGR